MSTQRGTVLPKLAKPDLIQIYIFLFLFGISGFALVGTWLGGAFLISNILVLVICVVTIVYNEAARVYYLFSYSLIVSILLDILAIGFNWNVYYLTTPGVNFFFGFILALLLIIGKLGISVNQIQTAKSMNNEPPIKINFEKLFKANKSGATVTRTTTVTTNQAPTVSTLNVPAMMSPVDHVDIEKQVHNNLNTTTEAATQSTSGLPAVVIVTSSTSQESQA